VGNYMVHTFTASGTFTVPENKRVPVQYLVIAGGGSWSGPSCRGANRRNSRWFWRRWWW
jgi:hypothetical protein